MRNRRKYRKTMVVACSTCGENIHKSKAGLNECGRVTARHIECATHNKELLTSAVANGEQTITADANANKALSPCWRRRQRRLVLTRLNEAKRIWPLFQFRTACS